nr:hypothetical protein [Tanacetum cinerariifolium]
MGKQWLLYKLGGDTSGCHGTSKKPTSKTRKKSEDKNISGGCMNAVLHMFDMQHHFVPFNQSSVNVLEQEHKNILKGVEAPRNSLELEEQQQDDVKEVASSSSSSLSSSKLKLETSFSIPNNGIQIKTKRSTLMDNNDVSSECSSSPSTKTPSLVARLMGLDLLPENSSPRTSLSSPRPSSSSSYYATPLNPLSKLSSRKNNVRSLPTTPRASTGARSSTHEVDYHHRFSLQVNNNKENKRRYDHESKSEYAKQYVQQLKENISRRVGADITNTTTKREQRRDECLVVLKPKRPSTLSSTATIDKSRNLDKAPSPQVQGNQMYQTRKE